MLLVSWTDVTGEPREHRAAPPVRIGRDRTTDVVIDSPGVSRVHAVVNVDGTSLLVTDRSANGTSIDGHRLAHATQRFRSPVTLDLDGQRVTIRLAPTDPDCSAPSLDLPLERATPPTVSPTARRRVHRALLDALDLASLDPSRLDRSALEPGVREALARICETASDDLPCGSARACLIDTLVDETLGLGPLESLLRDPSVSEIMVVDPATLYVERNGLIEPVTERFTDDDAVRAVLERIVTPLGRRIDESVPVVDARLPDGSRVHAIIPPLASRGPCITIRKFPTTPLTLPDLVARGSLCERMARLLVHSVRARKNVVISGGTGSGKTTLLNVLSAAVPERERIVTIEDAAELRLGQPHVVSLEARAANLEGKGAYSIRELVRNALRMRPDRIIVGECRGPEAVDMLQAMNTGHEGSMTTTHANNPREAVARLETLCLMAGLDLPIGPIRRQIAASIHLIVQQARMGDGSRRVTSISEVVGLDEHGDVSIAEIFRFERTGTGADGRVEGRFRPTGILPSYVDELVTLGLVGEEAPL